EIDNLEELKNDPQRLAMQELDRLKNPWPKDHILYAHTYDEMIAGIKNLTIDRVREVYFKLFSPDHLSMSLVGDCDADEVLCSLHNLIKARKNDFKYQRIPRP